jgi:hypothetical protein
MKTGTERRKKNSERGSMVLEKVVTEKEIEECRGREKPPVLVALALTTPKTATRSKPQVQTYEPPPIFTTTTVFVFGGVIIVLASIWTPLALVFVWIAARFQRYCFRINDEPSTRRRLLKDFQRTDLLTAPLRKIPDGVKVEESYWVNRRYVSSVVRGLS